MIVAKHKAHGFNTALKINLCTLLHWTKQDKSQTDVLIYLCGFIRKDTAIHNEGNLGMHWAHWNKDPEHRDHQLQFSFTWKENGHSQSNPPVYTKIFSIFSLGLSSQVAFYQINISAF